jgi:ferredoxin--NADP+ reductase
MIRHLAAEPGTVPPGRVTLLQAGSISAELGYSRELDTHARNYPWFEYIATVSRPWLDPAWQGETGRAEDVARKYLDRLGHTVSDTIVYLCGNPHMIRNFRALLERARFPKEAIREELYWVAR